MMDQMPIATPSPFLENLHHIAGFLIVVLVLIALWALTIAIGRVASLRSAGTAAPLKDTAPSAVGDEVEEPTEEEVVAISATVVALFGHHSKVVSIQPTTRDWSREGRREHFASHRIR